MTQQFNDTQKREKRKENILKYIFPVLIFTLKYFSSLEGKY